MRAATVAIAGLLSTCAEASAGQECPRGVEVAVEAQLRTPADTHGQIQRDAQKQLIAESHRHPITKKRRLGASRNGQDPRAQSLFQSDGTKPCRARRIWRAASAEEHAWNFPTIARDHRCRFGHGRPGGARRQRRPGRCAPRHPAPERRRAPQPKHSFRRRGGSLLVRAQPADRRADV